VRTEIELRKAAADHGLRVEWVEMAPIAPGSSEQVLTSKMTFEDPWAAAKFLLRSAKEDASDPIVRGWSLAILRHTAEQLGEDLSGSTVSPRLLDAYALELHHNVQRQIKFIHEPKETFQSARTTMRLRAGDCDDHARLLYALARAGNVRAKMVFFEVDDQPVHVVDMLRNSRGWRWAETTFAARFGENPYNALARIKPSRGNHPLAGLAGARDMGSPFLRFVTATDAETYKAQLDAVVRSMVRDAEDCATTAGTRLTQSKYEAFSAFVEAWVTFKGEPAHWYNAAAQYDKAEDFARQIADWQTELGKLCTLSAPTIQAPPELAGEVLSTIKVVAVGAAVVVGAFAVKAIAAK
jgi:hypothetical protein